MNPHTGQTVPIDEELFRRDPAAERARAAAEVGLDDAADLVLLEGTPENVQRVSSAVKAQAKARRRAANKRARQSRKRNR